MFTAFILTGILWHHPHHNHAAVGGGGQLALIIHYIQQNAGYGGMTGYKNQMQISRGWGVMSTHDFSYIYNDLTTPILGGSGRGLIYFTRALHRIQGSTFRQIEFHLIHKLYSAAAKQRYSILGQAWSQHCMKAAYPTILQSSKLFKYSLQKGVTCDQRTLNCDQRTV